MEQVTKLKRKRHLVIFIMITAFCISIMISKYDSYAWLTAQTYAEGRITNAKTSDLLKINVGKVRYLENCQVQSSVKVTNISNISIPIKLDLLSNEQGIFTKTKLLKPGQSLVSATKDSNYRPSCELKEIKYHLIGFEGYIDEDIVIPLVSAKMIKPVEQPKEEKIEEKKPESPKDNSTEVKVQPEVKKEKQKQPEQPAVLEQNQPETNTPATTGLTPTPPIENPTSTNPTTSTENSQPATPTSQTAEPPVDESEESAQKDA